MMVNKLATSISVAAVLAMTVSLAPQSAFTEEEVGIGEFSGSAMNERGTDTLNFTLDTSAVYSQENSQEKFSGAIQNANYIDRCETPLQEGFAVRLDLCSRTL